MALTPTVAFRPAATHSRFRLRAMAVGGTLLVAGFAAPASAAHEPSTKLVRCGEQSCLLVKGHRDDTASIVSINGRAVAVEGGHRWKVRVPVDTVRRWSAPYARTIDVALRDPARERETVTTADLPIGLLGHTTDLASLEVRVR